MELASAYLFGIHPTPIVPRVSLGIRDPATRDLLAYLPGGLVWGAAALADVPGVIPDFWKAKIEHCYVQYSPDTVADYALNISIVELKSTAVWELAKLKSEFPRRVNELYGALLPPERMPRRSGGHSYPSILFCQPSQVETSYSMEEFASDAVALMGWESCAVLPALLQNALFVASPYSLWEYESVGAFALERPPATKHIAIPRVVRDLLHYQSLTFMLEDLHERAACVPFVQKTVAEYLSTLQNMGHRASYSKQFLTYLKDSEAAARQLKAIEDVLRLVDAAISQNGFVKNQSSATTFQVRLPPLVRGSVLDLITNECDQAAREVTSNITIGTDRQKAIGDYLRDAANSEATVANLRLQRLVIMLAIVTVLLGVAALIPGLLTEEQKASLWHGKSNPLQETRAAPSAPTPPSPPSK